MFLHVKILHLENHQNSSKVWGNQTGLQNLLLELEVLRTKRSLKRTKLE